MTLHEDKLITKGEKRKNLHASEKTPIQKLDITDKTSLDDPPEISSKDLARIACIRQYLQESYKNGVILQVQKSLERILQGKV